MIGLGVTRGAEETWRQTVERIAKVHHLENECLEIFDREVKEGEDEAQAAWNALFAWDCLSMIDARELVKK